MRKYSEEIEINLVWDIPCMKSDFTEKYILSLFVLFQKLFLQFKKYL